MLNHVTYDHTFTDAYYFYQFTRKANQISSSSSSSSSSGSSLSLLRDEFVVINNDFDKTIKEGYLEKQGAVVKNWKRRYFILKKGFLYYYKEKEVNQSNPISNSESNYKFHFQNHVDFFSKGKNTTRNY